MKAYIELLSIFTLKSGIIFIGVFDTASLLKSPGLFLVFWLILTMLKSGWSWFVLRCPTLSVLFPSLLETVPSVLVTSGITVTRMVHSFLSSLARSNPSFHFLWFLLYGLLGRQNPLYSKFFCFCQLSLGLVSWSRSGGILYIIFEDLWANL